MYLYIFEDGRAIQQETSPTHDDLVAIGDGILDVYTKVGALFVAYNPSGIMEDVKQHGSTSPS